jgi:hypothetical protein
LQLIQILRIKNLTRTVPWFPVQMAPGVNSVSPRMIGTKSARGVPKAAISDAETGFSSVPRFTRR